MAVPKMVVTENKSLVEYRFIGGGWLPMVVGASMFAPIFTPYFIVLFRGTLNPILPFVSQAAGSPPQSGVFSILLSLTALTSFIAMHLLHMGIRLYKEKLQVKKEQQIVDFLNRAMLIPGHLGILGMIIVGGYPIDYHRHNDDWLQVTIIPHVIGSGSLFIGGIFYCILFTYIMSIIHPHKKELQASRLTFIAVIIFSAALHAFTVNPAFMVEYEDENRLKSCTMEPLEYNLYYIVCSICEWVLLIAFVCFFMTMREEAKELSLTMTITMNERTDEVASTISSSVMLSKNNSCMIKKAESEKFSEKSSKQEIPISSSIRNSEF